MLGSIVHSRPVVIDYYNSSGALSERYIAVGANDGMLHIFDDHDDQNGQEVLAFVPRDLLPRLKYLPEENFVDMVDGPVRLYRKNNQPKYLIFGLRRGGGSYWCLNVTNSDPSSWTVEWIYDNPEISQSWSEPQFAAIPTSVNSSTGAHEFKDVMIVTGGYDAEEDNYPEPFEDANNSGSPFADNGSIDNQEWFKNKADQDINGNNKYDLYNPGQNENGRGMFIVDIDDPSNVLYSISYNASGSIIEQGMKWCFPASPTVVTNTYAYKKEEDGSIVQKRKTNVLKAVYANDVYGNVYKINFDLKSTYDSDNGTFSVVPSSLADRWSVTKVFSANPPSSGNAVNTEGEFTQGINLSGDDIQGLKAFYPPTVSWGGACQFFDTSNYRFSGATFEGTNEIASLYFGTGDMAHPTYTMKKNRFFAVYDDTSVSARKDENGDSVTVSTAPYYEADLVDLTCDELDQDTTLSGTTVTKSDYRTALTDDPVYYAGDSQQLENETNEDDAKGWYIILEDQGDTTKCSHCDYASSFADVDHKWEKVLSKPQLFAKTLYFTTYQPDISDICNPKGNGFSYSLNYCDASATYSLSTSNAEDEKDVTDRYIKVDNIFGIPSGFSVVVREGEAGAMSMLGGKMVGAKGGSDYEINNPGTGLNLYYWLEGNTIE